MRRKTFDVLFEPGAGMAAIAKQPSLWRSAFYFTLSFSFFGVATNCWLLDSPLDVRFGIIIATVLIAGTALTLYGFLLHGIMETFGALAGDPVGLICLWAIRRCLFCCSRRELCWRAGWVLTACRS